MTGNRSLSPSPIWILAIGYLALDCTRVTSVIDHPGVQVRWADITPDSASLHPSPRYNSSAVYDSVSKSMIIFGGRDTLSIFADVWSFSLTARTWTNITPSDGSPSSRFAHTAVIDPSSRKMYIWSGQGQGNVFFNDTWAFDIQSQRWQNVTPAGLKPAVRYGSAAVYDPRRMSVVTFAGFTNQGRFDDSWNFSVDSLLWLDITPTGTQPAPRCLHTAVYEPSGHQLVVYGGQRIGPLDDIWSFDLSTYTWNELSPPLRPTGRFFSTIVTLRDDRAVVFGGSTVFGEVNEAWIFDIERRSWKLLAVPSPHPSPRHGHAAIYVPRDDCMIIFSGRNGSMIYNDVWTLENVSGRL